MHTESGNVFSDLRALIETSLRDRAAGADWTPAVRYAVFSGGKRIRPLLSVLAAQACGADPARALPAACAVEFLHTASLILDDLPCMDNADERRGRASVHVKFGEAAAALAVVSLLNQAYGIFGSSPRLAAEAEKCVAETIAGQSADLTRAQPDRTFRKSAGLLRLAFTAAPLACEATAEDISVLAECGRAVGQAYQIYDDFEDGDAASAAGAEELTSEAGRLLREHFGTPAAPLISGIEAVFLHCKGKRLAAA